MPLWVITGATGFLGRNALDLLARTHPSATIVCLGRRHPTPHPRVEFVSCDLDDQAAFAGSLRELQPDFVLHLAGQTPPASVELLYQRNTKVTAVLLNSLANLGHRCRVVLAGSAAELGPVPDRLLPASESTPCRPEGAYALSKWTATRLGLLAPAPLEVMVARVFNPIGPGMPAAQAFGRFARLLATRPAPPSLRVHNLDARRDFIDVRDVASALVALADRGQSHRLYHVASGRSHSIRDGLVTLIRHSGHTLAIEESDQPSPSGPIDSRASIERITTEIGWTPRIDWERSLRDLWLSVAEPAALPLPLIDLPRAV